MRECIYCGRTLEKGEKCTCAMSVAKRMEKEGKTQAKEEPKKKPKKEKRAKKERVKRTKTYKSRTTSIDTKNSFARAWRLFLSFLRAPVDTVMNPGEMSWATIIILTAFEGVIVGLSVFAVTLGSQLMPMAFTGNTIDISNVMNIKGWNVFTVTCVGGGISIALFFLYSSLFYVVNRFVMRQFFGYHEFVKRFAFVPLPVAILGVVSIIFGVFSQTTFIALMICGGIGSLIITYEILRSLWYEKSPGKIMYAMMACSFVFLWILCKFIKIA